MVRHLTPGFNGQRISPSFPPALPKISLPPPHPFPSCRRSLSGSEFFALNPTAGRDLSRLRCPGDGLWEGEMQRICLLPGV